MKIDTTVLTHNESPSIRLIRRFTNKDLSGLIYLCALSGLGALALVIARFADVSPGLLDQPYRQYQCTRQCFSHDEVSSSLFYARKSMKRVLVSRI
jgi:hypothetical protein